jgi:phage shock protein A
MGWLDRLGRGMRSQINSSFAKNEDPEKLLEKAVMEMEGQLIELRRALAESIALLKSTERLAANQQQAAQKWYDRAKVALVQGNEAQARDALLQRQSYQARSRSLQEQIEQQNEAIAKLKQDLRKLEEKYTEVKTKKNLYLARLKAAIATQKIHEVSGVSRVDADSVFERVESKLLELEAEAELTAALKKDGLEDKFATLEESDRI